MNVKTSGLALILAAAALLCLCGCEKKMKWKPDEKTLPSAVTTPEPAAQGGTEMLTEKPESGGGSGTVAGEGTDLSTDPPETASFSVAGCNLYLLSFPPAALIFEERETGLVTRVAPCGENGSAVFGEGDWRGRSLCSAAELLADACMRESALPEGSAVLFCVLSYTSSDTSPLETQLDRFRTSLGLRFGENIRLDVEWAENARTPVSAEGDVAYCGCPDCEEGRVTCPRCMGDWEHGVAVISPGVPAVSFQACPDCDRGTLVCPRCGGAGGWTLSVRR